MQITVTRDYALMHWVDEADPHVTVLDIHAADQSLPLRPTARTVAAQHRGAVMFAMAIFRHRARGFLLSPRLPAGASFLCPHRSTALF